MPRPNRSRCWAARTPGKYPNFYVYADKTGPVEIDLFNAAGEEGYTVHLPRRDARLLVRRLVKALDS
jgi:hypothetical protein